MHQINTVQMLVPAQGLMLDDMMPKDPPSEKGTGSATHLGLCRHSTSPCVRRIDLKWYPRRYVIYSSL